jgi:hypothetical protein
MFQLGRAPENPGSRAAEVVGAPAHLSQDFHFGILSRGSIHATGSLPTAILHCRRQRAVR